MTFHFGKFKGVSIESVEIGYLIYALDNFTNMDDALIYAIKSEILFRLDIQQPNNNKIEYRSIYLSLAKKYHPDKGGTNEAMKAINDFYQLLCKM